MKIHKSAFFLLAGVLLIVRLAMVDHHETPLPFAQTDLPGSLIFSSDKTIIPAGDCITLSWAVPQAARVVLHGSNWPEGVQKGMSQQGSSIVCPSAATNYIPNEPVHYTLLASYNDGHIDTQEIVIHYETVSDAQALPSATFDPYATPVTMPVTVTPDATIAAIFQPFENGWILWRGNNDTFFILLGDGSMFANRSDSPLQPIFQNEPTPPDRFDTHALLSGIWRSWVSRGLVSEMVGWATAPAHTYNARVFGQVDFGFGMTLPDGRYVNLNFNGAWYLEGITDGTWTVSGSPVTFTPPSYPTLTPTATATPSRVAAIYQAFENGFMVAAEAGNCAYIFAYSANDSDGNIVIPYEVRELDFYTSTYHYCIEFGGLPEVVFSQPPNGLQNPGELFGRLWAAYSDVREALGYATAPQQRYISALPAVDNSYGGGPFSTPMMQLPDGKSLWCGFRAATSGTCSVG